MEFLVYLEYFGGEGVCELMTDVMDESIMSISLLGQTPNLSTRAHNINEFGVIE